MDLDTHETYILPMRNSKLGSYPDHHFFMSRLNLLSIAWTLFMNRDYVITHSVWWVHVNVPVVVYVTVR